MKLRLTLIAAATALYCAAPMAAENPTNWPTYSPNPNKAQNSDMRTQAGSFYREMGPGEYYMYPSTTSEIYVAPAVTSEVYVYPSEPTAGTRSIYVPASPETPAIGQNYTPNPNKVQNNGVPTQY